MAQVLIRDLDDDIVERLKIKAKSHHRSLQSELKIILSDAALSSISNTSKLAAKIRKKLSGRLHSDSAVSVSEDRQR